MSTNKKFIFVKENAKYKFDERYKHLLKYTSNEFIQDETLIIIDESKLMGISITSLGVLSVRMAMFDSLHNRLTQIGLI